MKKENRLEKAVNRVFVLFRHKVTRNILYLVIIAFSALSMLFIDKENTIRTEFFPFLDNNILSNLLTRVGIRRYNVTSSAWVWFMIILIIAIMFAVGNIVAPKFIDKKVKDNPELFSTEKRTRIWYSFLFYGVLFLIALVLIGIAAIVGAFGLYDGNTVISPIVGFLKMLVLLFEILLHIFIILVVIFLIFDAILALFRKKKPVAETEEEPVIVPVAATVATEEPAPVEEVKEEPVAEVAPVVAPVAEPKVKTRKVVQKSFTGKMSQAKKEQVAFYNELKNHLLSYKRVNSRISWHYDSFNIGREKAVKIAFRGKTMVAFFALDPKKYEDTKYYPHDMSSKKKFAETPMMVKIKSERGVKFAKELVDVVCEGLPVKNSFTPETYKFPAMSNKKLIENGLAKVVVVKL